MNGKDYTIIGILKASNLQGQLIARLGATSKQNTKPREYNRELSSRGRAIKPQQQALITNQIPIHQDSTKRKPDETNKQAAPYLGNPKREKIGPKQWSNDKYLPTTQ